MPLRTLTREDLSESARADFDAAKTSRSDLALVTRDLPAESIRGEEHEAIGAEWDGNAIYVVVRRDASEEDREANVNMLLSRCRAILESSPEAAETTKER